VTADVPRRLPRTQQQRLVNVDRTHAAQSLGGATAAARPVPNRTPDVKIYQPSTSGSNVVTGTGDVTSVSIASTTAGAGETDASGADSVAIGEATATGARSVSIGLAVADGDDTVAIGDGASSAASGSTTVGGAQVHETANSGTAIGNAASVGEASEYSSALGGASVRWADYATAVGPAAIEGASADERASYATAIGAYAYVGHAGGVAIGADHDGNSAETTAVDDFVLGTENHHVLIAGALVLSDGGTLYRITVTGGVLGLVAYP
jgi:hypothetical protein